MVILYDKLYDVKKQYSQCTLNVYSKAGGSSLVVLVLAGPVFLKVKIKVNFYKKQVINKSASVIFELARLIVLSYSRQKSLSRGVRLSTAHALCLQGILLC